LKGRKIVQSCTLDWLSVLADISNPLSVIRILAKFHISASLKVYLVAVEIVKLNEQWASYPPHLHGALQSSAEPHRTPRKNCCHDNGL